MPVQLPSEEVLLAIYETVRQHNVAGAARKLGIPESTLRHRYLAAVRTLNLPDIVTRGTPNAGEVANETEVSWPVENGTFLVFGDCHWTNTAQPRSVAHEALLRAAPMIKPDFFLCMGDALDLGEISRHDPVGWTPVGMVKDTIAAGQLHFGEISDRAPKAKKFWCIGNHDERYDNYLAKNAAAFAGEEGMRLSEKFADWRMAWRFDFGPLYALHRWHSGEHAAYNNSLKISGSIVTGDTHKLRVTARENLKGRVYGIESGMLADPNWPCFSYAKGRPNPWTQGWVILTIRHGRMLQPETCEVINGVAWFRGEALAGKPRVRVSAGRGS